MIGIEEAIIDCGIDLTPEVTLKLGPELFPDNIE